jgi:hypothetical protein
MTNGCPVQFKVLARRILQRLIVADDGMDCTFYQLQPQAQPQPNPRNSLNPPETELATDRGLDVAAANE